MLDHYQHASKNAITKRHLMAFHWRTDDRSLIVVLGSSLPSSTKLDVVKVGPPLTKLSGSAHDFKLNTPNNTMLLKFLFRLGNHCAAKYEHPPPKSQWINKQIYIFDLDRWLQGHISISNRFCHIQTIINHCTKHVQHRWKMREDFTL